MQTLYTQSAGGLVVNPDGNILIVNQKGNSWSLPKGHVDPGEDLLSTAIREILEESGVTDLCFVCDLGSYKRYRIAKDGVSDDMSELKEIMIFLFTSGQKELKPVDPDNPEARWASESEAMSLLSHKKDKEFLAASLALLPSMLSNPT